MFCILIFHQLFNCGLVYGQVLFCLELSSSNLDGTIAIQLFKYSVSKAFFGFLLIIPLDLVYGIA